MERSLETFRHRYTQSLQEYLSGETDGALNQADQLGRQASADGLHPIVVAAIHHQALLQILQPGITPEQSQRADQAVQMLYLACPLGDDQPESGMSGLPENALGPDIIAPAMLRQLTEMLETEAKRIAQSLHDEAGSLLTPLHMKLAAATRQAPHCCLPCFEEIRALLDCVEVQLRRISHELQPPLLSDFGLVPALEFLIHGVSERAGLAISLRSSVDRRLPEAVETAVYRAVQEGLTNVSRHARATRATVELRMEGPWLVCKIRDNGIGFDAACGDQGGLGLRGLRVRVAAVQGQVAIRSTPGEGTELAVRIPSY